MDTPEARNIFLVIAWSFGLYILMYLYQYLGFFIASRKSGQTFEAVISGEFESPQTKLTNSLTALLVGVPMVLLVTRFLWGRSWEWMRFHFDLRSLALGLAIGIVLPFVILLILRFLGIAMVSYQPKLWQSKDAYQIIFATACLAIFTGLAEEVVFRGMAVREMALRYDWLLATVVGGVYFGGVHLLSRLRKITLVDALWILMGSMLVTILFVALYRRSQSLWLPIGFHMAWNFCLAGVMGVSLSGNKPEAGFLNVELTGSSLLTGGEFGMETSVVSLIIYVLAAILALVIPWGGQFSLLSSH
jgi:membrane protease YdiL (CAAX protease family)